MTLWLIPPLSRRSPNVHRTSPVLEHVAQVHDRADDTAEYDRSIELCESLVLQFREKARSQKYEARQAGNESLTRRARSVHERVLCDYVSALQQKGRPTEKAVRSLFFLFRLLLEQCLK